MSSSMRRRNGLMGFSLIGVSPVLRLECFDPSILKTECPVCHLISVGLNPSSIASLRAALSRGSGFVLWHSTDSAQCWPTAGHRARFLGYSRHTRSMRVASSALPRLWPFDHCADALWVEGLTALVAVAGIF